MLAMLVLFNHEIQNQNSVKCLTSSLVSNYYLSWLDRWLHLLLFLSPNDCGLYHCECYQIGNWVLLAKQLAFWTKKVSFPLMQELLYLYGFVIDNNPDDYLMVISCIRSFYLVHLLYMLSSPLQYFGFWCLC